MSRPFTLDTIKNSAVAKINRMATIKTSEATVHQQVVNYLKLQYPKIPFRTDFAAGIKMTLGQAVKHKKIQHCKAWPDIFVAYPSRGHGGLFLELKKARSEVYLKSGLLKNDAHILEQHDVLLKLTQLGYEATFACGFDEAKRIIDEYLMPQR